MPCQSVLTFSSVLTYAQWEEISISCNNRTQEQVTLPYRLIRVQVIR